jgi:hypothetical protein
MEEGCLPRHAELVNSSKVWLVEEKRAKRMESRVVPLRFRTRSLARLANDNSHLLAGLLLLGTRKMGQKNEINNRPLQVSVNRSGNYPVFES